MHPNSLANLRPGRKGEIRNPEGRNQWTGDRERRERFRAACRALNSCQSEELEQQLIEALALQVIQGALSRDTRLLVQILDHIWSLEYADRGRRAWNRTRRQLTAAGLGHQ